MGSELKIERMYIHIGPCAPFVNGFLPNTFCLNIAGLSLEGGLRELFKILGFKINIYRTRAIITRGLYTFYPLFEVHLFTVTFGLMYG